jgi:hypothetical protein
MTYHLFILAILEKLAYITKQLTTKKKTACRRLVVQPKRGLSFIARFVVLGIEYSLP